MARPETVTPSADPARRVLAVRIDIVTIFPEFFGVLDVSLLGRARQGGLLDLHVHDLRDFTTTGTAPSTTPRTAAAPAWS